MSSKSRIYTYKSQRKVIARLRDDLKSSDFVLLYAYNGTGKTRLSMEFKEAGKRRRGITRDTLYFNAFTEDLFHWNNDLENDEERTLIMNSESEFFKGFRELALEDKIFKYLERYADFNFKIDYDNWKVVFHKNIPNERYRLGSVEPEYIEKEYLKISRGEENMFIWSVFLAISELAIDGAEAYNWVEFLYIDDPISSLDDNNTITVASDLAKLLAKVQDKIKVIISSHHSLFFNVMSNELNKYSHKKYFLNRIKNSETYKLRSTNELPFFHHVAMISELKQASSNGDLYTYHFNILRGVLEKTATFFGLKDFGDCIQGVDDQQLYERALDVLSHSPYAVFEPKEMIEDNKELFQKILGAFLVKYEFNLPEMT